MVVAINIEKYKLDRRGKRGNWLYCTFFLQEIQLVCGGDAFLSLLQSSLVFVCIYSYTSIHTCIHTYIHTYIHTSYIHPSIHSYIHPYIYISIHTFIHTFMHTLTNLQNVTNYVTDM